jgi:hypothetical protein
MAPYGGPSIAELVAMFRRGKPPHAPTLGFGLPRAPLYEKDGGFELHRLSGGEGFGVQPDLVSPFVDEGIIVRTATWQEMIAWLCEHWQDDWGPAMRKGEKLVVAFRGDTKALATALHHEMSIGLTEAMAHAREGLAIDRIKTAASVCRAARLAGVAIDFDTK